MAKALIAARCGLMLALLAVPSFAFAHQLDEYLQATLVTIEPGGIRLNINLTPGVAVAGQVLDLIDTDQNGEISSGEATAYGESFKRDLVARIDEREIALKLVACYIPKPEDLRTGWEFIQMEFSAVPASLAAGTHHLTLENKHLPAISAYLVNAARPGTDMVEITAQRRNENQSTGQIEFTLASPANSPPRHSSIATGIIAALASLLLALLTGVWRAGRSTRLTPKSAAAL